MAWTSYKGEGWTKTRGELLPDSSPHKALPIVKFAPYLLQYCFEVGMVKSGAMGAVALEWVDLAAWVSLSKVYLHPEEARIIIDASRNYVSWLAKSKDDNCPAPFPETTED